MLRRRVLGLYQRILRHRSKRCAPEELQKSAVVIAPHFDDETLGCGGTVLQKRRAGAEIAIVFMTDGSTSHAQQISPDELRRLRAAEGLAAAKALGLGQQDVYHLAFAEAHCAISKTLRPAR